MKKDYSSNLPYFTPLWKPTQILIDHGILKQKTKNNKNCLDLLKLIIQQLSPCIDIP